MIKSLPRLLVVFLFLPLKLYSQDSGAGLNYQLTVINNPSVTGGEGDGFLRLSYLNFYPGNNYNLHSVSLSYDGYFSALHGGAGIYLSNDYLGGIINDLKGGLSYSYYFKASRDLYISAGLSASFYHRGFNLSGAILPDQIDPMAGVVIPTEEALSSRGRTVFDLATGFLFMSGKFFGGISVAHLAEPNLDDSGYSDQKLKRRLFIHGAADFNLSKGKNLKIRPLAKLEMQEGFLSAGAGSVLESKSLSINVILLADNKNNIDLQTGFSIIISSLNIFYNYRFNIASRENLLPFSLFHHAGIALRLNNVDKRKTVKTINFPKL
jgi:type IX secretion system PorP/SprF family membrane protein